MKTLFKYLLIFLPMVSLAKALDSYDDDLHKSLGSTIFQQYGEGGVLASNFTNTLANVGTHPLTATLLKIVKPKLPLFLTLLKNNVGDMASAIFVFYPLDGSMVLRDNQLYKWWTNLGGNKQDLIHVVNNLPVIPGPPITGVNPAYIQAVKNGTYNGWTDTPPMNIKIGNTPLLDVKKLTGTISKDKKVNDRAIVSAAIVINSFINNIWVIYNTLQVYVGNQYDSTFDFTGTPVFIKNGIDPLVIKKEIIFNAYLELYNLNKKG